MSVDDMQETWTAVDTYISAQVVPSDPVLDAAIAANAQAGLPAIDVAPNQGKLLYLLAKMRGAKRILEVGTLGGYSTIWLARALAEGGHIVTLELAQKHADVARENLRRAGYADRVEIRVGPAAESLERLVEEKVEAFDFIFIDADKPSNPIYLEWAMKLARLGTVIVVDNVVREGRLADAESDDAGVHGSRAMLERMGAERRLTATAIQTVGSKGYDGFAMALVIAD